MTTMQMIHTVIVFVASIASSGYPYSYSNEEVQRWLMCGTPSNRLCIHFADIDTENVHD